MFFCFLITRRRRKFACLIEDATRYASSFMDEITRSRTRLNYMCTRIFNKSNIILCSLSLVVVRQQHVHNKTMLFMCHTHARIIAKITFNSKNRILCRKIWLTPTRFLIMFTSTHLKCCPFWSNYRRTMCARQMGSTLLKRTLHDGYEK